MASGHSSALKRVGENLYVNSHGRYFAWFSIRGKQIKRSLKTKDKPLARRRLAKLREKGARLHGAEDRNIHFEELAELWLKSIRPNIKDSTFTRRGVFVNQLTPFFKGMPVRSISLENIEKWRITRAGSIAARTFNKELETLNHLMRYACDVKGILLENPAEDIALRKVAKPVVRIPSKEQFESLLVELRKEPQAVRSGAVEFVEFLAYTGLRLGEAREVKWCDINLERNTLLVTGGEHGTKNLNHRVIPLFPSARLLIERMMKARHNKIDKDERIYLLKDVRQALTSACRRAKLPHFGHHPLRHFFCSNAIEAGIDFKAIAGWLGHSDGGVLVAKTYGHLREEHSVAMAQRMQYYADPDSKS